MKPFMINRNSWHYKLNMHFMNEYGSSERNMEYNWEPQKADFCSYWSATIFRLIFAGVVIAAAIFLIASLGYAIYQHPTAVFASVMLLVSFCMFIFGILYIIEKLRTTKKERSESLFMQKYRAHKQKICPMVVYQE